MQMEFHVDFQVCVVESIWGFGKYQYVEQGRVFFLFFTENIFTEYIIHHNLKAS